MHDRLRFSKSLLQIASALACAVLMLAAAPPAQDPESEPASERPALALLSEQFTDLVNQVEPTVVRVYSSGLSLDTRSDQAGSGGASVRRRGGVGVFVSAQGHVVTNAHLVAGATEIRVMRILASEGPRVEGSAVRPRGELVKAELLGYDLETDLAVLKTDQLVLRYLRFGDSDRLSKGSLVFAFGSPRGMDDSLSMGIVSSTARQLSPDDPMIYLQTDASVTEANDGGPLVDGEGRLVGLSNIKKIGPSDRFGYAAPSNIVRTVYEQIRSGGSVRRGVLGISTRTITPQMAAALKLPVDHGVIVEDVLPGGPASMRDVRIGDVILNLDDKPMENARQLEVNIYQRRLGDAVKLTALRDGEEIAFEVSVAERPKSPAEFSAWIKDPTDHFVRQLGILGVDLDEDLSDMMPWTRVDGGVIVAALPAAVVAGLRVRAWRHHPRRERHARGQPERAGQSACAFRQGRRRCAANRTGQSASACDCRRRVDPRLPPLKPTYLLRPRPKLPRERLAPPRDG